MSFYGTDAANIQQIARGDEALRERLAPELPYIGAEVVWAARAEMARSVEDVLARRTRSLFLNSKAAIKAAPKTARLLAQELGRDAEWEKRQVAEFNAVARHFTLEGVVEEVGA